jgi:pimeloyl-ACP methyl ester carboxylesterase
MRETLVMLHGGGTDSRCWEGVRPLLAPHFDLVTPDLPGHRDEPPVRRARVEDVAEHMADWIAREVGAPYHLLGHSFGGMVAMTVAAFGPSPARLILADTFDRPANSWQGWGRLIGMGLGARVLGRNRASVKVAELQGLGHEGFDAQLRAAMHHDAAMSLGQLMDAVRRFDGRPALDRIERLGLPVLLLMAGGHEATEMAGLRMEARVASARRVVIPEVGHMLMRDAPEAFARAVVEFLGSDLSRSA